MNNLEEQCTVCNLLEIESVQHIFFECPFYTSLRSNSILSLNNMRGLSGALSGNNLALIKEIGYYVANLLKLRAFLKNE